MKKTHLLALCLSVSLLVGATGCSQPSATTGVRSWMAAAPQIQVLDTPDYREIAYEINNGLESSVRASAKPLDLSYYATLMSRSEQAVYRALKQAVVDHTRMYVPIAPITAGQLRQMMRQLLLDEPELFFLLPEYAYQADESGVVTQIDFSYGMEEEQAGICREALQAQSLLGLGEAPEYTVLKKAMDLVALTQVIREPDPEQQAALDFEVNLYDTAYPVLVKSDAQTPGVANIRGLSLALVHLLRRNGVMAFVMHGESTAQDLESWGDLIPAFGEAKESVRTEGGKTRVKLDASGYYTWVMVRLNDKFYHVDPFYNALFSQSVLPGYYPILGFSDEQASVSRKFYHQEPLLGIQPMAPSDNFLYGLRHPAGIRFLPTKDATSTMLDAEKTIDQILSATADRTVIQFASLQNYQYFTRNIYSLVKERNSRIQPGISSFDYTFYPSALVAVIHDIKRVGQ